MPDPVPLRLRVVRALQAVLEGVTPANGYQSDLTGRVFRDRAFFGPNDPTPLVVILEQANDVTGAGKSAAPIRSNVPGAEIDWPLIVQGFCAVPDQAYMISAEVVKALVKEAQRGAPPRYDILGTKNVLGLHVGRPIVRPPDGEGASSAYFWVEVILTLAEDRLDPFA